jgi:transcriptional regulator with XRE-family HTH domain
MDPITIGAKISNGRKKEGLTLDDVAKKCDTTRQNIKRIESGNFVRPDYELIYKIFDYLKIDKSDLPIKELSPTEATSETDLAAKWKTLADHYKRLADKYAEKLAEKGLSID